METIRGLVYFTVHHRVVYIACGNGTAYTYASSCYGTRPVVVLKAGILTSESKDKQFLGQTCWTVYESE